MVNWPVAIVSLIAVVKTVSLGHYNS